jgi:hypothetical protein
MSTRLTGLLLALLFLALAVPASLDHCQDSPSHGWSQPQAVAAVSAAPVTSSAVRECTENPAPAQNPYIETSNGSGRSAAVSRTSATTDHTVAAMTIVTSSAVRGPDVSADGTGPPLWLSTCVSRT